MSCLNPELFLHNENIDKYICPINSGVLNDPVYDECGHAFCESCFKDLEETICPVSKKAISKETTEAHDLREEILSLNYRCDADGKLCNWTGKFGDYSEHEETDCPLQEVKCTNDLCELTVKRGELKQHVETCEMTRKKCEFCDFVHNDIVMEDHHNVDCPGIEVDCEFNCICTYKRKHRDIHVMYGCETAKHDCYFRNAGCYFTGTWQEMGGHASDALALHGSFLEQKLSQFEAYKKKTEEILRELATIPEIKAKVDHFVKVLDDLEDEDHPLFTGEFLKEFSNPSLEFLNSRTVLSSGVNQLQLLFIDRGFHEKHRIVFTVDKYSEKDCSKLSVGLCRKEHMFKNQITTYTNENASDFVLISDESPNGGSQDKMKFVENEDYLISYNEKDCEFIVETLESKPGRKASLAKIEFPPEFFEWQPVFVLSGNTQISLIDFTDWTQN